MKRVAVLLIAGLASLSVSAETLEGRVVGISDGDTFTLLTSIKLEVKIRLKDVDAPERNQPYRAKSKKALSDLVYGEVVRVEHSNKGSFGRIVGKVFVGDTDVSAELVRQGAVWVYQKYSQDKKLLALEVEARLAKRGLWGIPNPVPPWDWRKGENSPEGCRIKGNISKNGKLYHMPGDPSYKQTKINIKKGEKWFCSEAEAEAAGWTRARRR